MGAVFSVTYGKDRVIMDFGSAFDPEKSGYVKKDDNWIRDKLDHIRTVITTVRFLSVICILTI